MENEVWQQILAEGDQMQKTLPKADSLLSREEFREWVATQDPNMPLYSQGESGNRVMGLVFGAWTECPVDRWQHDVHGEWVIVLGYEFLYASGERAIAGVHGTWLHEFARAIDDVADDEGWENVTAKHALKVLDELEVADA